MEESIENYTTLGGDNDKVDGIVEETIHPSKLVSVERSPEEKVTDEEISEEVAVEGVEVGKKALSDEIDLSSELVEESDELGSCRAHRLGAFNLSFKDCSEKCFRYTGSLVPNPQRTLALSLYETFVMHTMVF